MGIGLPHFMIDNENQWIVLPPILILLLIIVPNFFVKWMQGQKPTDEVGNLIANYNMMYSLLSPKISTFTCSVMMGCMKELDTLYPEKKKLDPAFEEGFKNILLHSKALTNEQLEAI